MESHTFDAGNEKSGKFYDLICPWWKVISLALTGVKSMGSHLKKRTWLWNDLEDHGQGQI